MGARTEVSSLGELAEEEAAETFWCPFVRHTCRGFAHEARLCAGLFIDGGACGGVYGQLCASGLRFLWESWVQLKSGEPAEETLAVHSFSIK